VIDVLSRAPSFRFAFLDLRGGHLAPVITKALEFTQRCIISGAHRLAGQHFEYRDDFDDVLKDDPVGCHDCFPFSRSSRASTEALVGISLATVRAFPDGEVQVYFSSANLDL
jgi:hypothetical protein